MLAFKQKTAYLVLEVVSRWNFVLNSWARRVLFYDEFVGRISFLGYGNSRMRRAFKDELCRIPSAICPTERSLGLYDYYPKWIGSVRNMRRASSSLISCTVQSFVRISLTSDIARSRFSEEKRRKGSKNENLCLQRVIFSKRVEKKTGKNHEPPKQVLRNHST